MVKLAIFLVLGCLVDVESKGNNMSKENITFLKSIKILLFKMGTTSVYRKVQ